MPRVQINSGGGGQGDGAGGLQALIGMLLSEKGIAMLSNPATEGNDAVTPDKESEVAAE